MSNNFAYGACLGGNTESRGWEAIEDQKFSYGNVTYSKYAEVYQPVPKNALIFSKVVAPIFVIGYGVVKSIYHLALALFKGTAKWISQKDSSYFKSHLYTAAREVEQGTGWFIRIFHDRLGSYLIEDAQHHVSMYKFFIQGEYRLDQSDILERSSQFM